jgi:hypothetical protein
MRTNVSFLLLALPIFMGQSMAVAQENCYQSFLMRDFAADGLDGYNGLTVEQQFARAKEGLVDKIKATYCLKACKPCNLLDVQLFTSIKKQCRPYTEEDLKADVEGKNGTEEELKKFLNANYCIEWFDAACHCTGGEKKDSQASTDVIR